MLRSVPRHRFRDTATNSPTRPYLALPRAVAIASTLIIVVAFVQLVEGARGVDQHWYLADTEQLMSDGEPRTNTVFAGLLLRGESDMDGSNFVHNGPLLHFNARLGHLIGAFEAWKLTNLLMHLGCAVLVGLAVRRLCDELYGWLAYTALLLAPISLWQAANLFQDTLYALLSAVVLYATVHRDRPAALWCAALALGIGSLSHPLFAFLGTGYAWLNRSREEGRTLSLITLAAVIAAQLLRERWFPATFQPDLRAIIGSAATRGSNMYWHLATEPLATTPEFLLRKAGRALYLQFAHLRYAVLNLPTNLGLIALAALLLYRKSARVPMWMAVAVMLYALHTLIILLMQNQPRYQVVVVPAAILSVAFLLRAVPYRRTRWLAASSLLAVPVLVFDITLLEYVRMSHHAQTDYRDRMLAVLGELPPGARVAFAGRDATDIYVPSITALGDRPALLLDRLLLDERSVARALALFDPDLIVSDVAGGAEALGGVPVARVPASGRVPAQLVFRMER